MQDGDPKDRKLAGQVRCGSKAEDVTISVYRQDLPSGKRLYVSEVQLKPGDTIAVDGNSREETVRRMRMLLPLSISCRKIMGKS